MTIQPTRPAGSAPDAIPARKGEILVVDDEFDLARGMAALLTRRGFKAHAVGDPADALDLVRSSSGRWAVVLTDLTMPGMDGRELRTHLAAIDPDLPVVLMSGLEDEAEAPGFAARLVKPFRVDELLPLLRPFLA